MRFRIEGIQPMFGEQLRAALEERRDHWARVVVQDDQDPAFLASEELIIEARARSGLVPGGLAAGAEVPADAHVQIRAAVERQNALIVQQNQTPGPAMAGALLLIATGIGHAVDLSNAYGCPVRVTIEGHYNIEPSATRGGYKRIAIKVDDAILG